MFRQYCSNCKSDKQDEFELLEYRHEGDWEWFHEPCGEKAVTILADQEERE